MSKTDICLLICVIFPLVVLFIIDIYFDKKNEEKRRREKKEKDKRSRDDWIDPGD